MTAALASAALAAHPMPEKQQEKAEGCKAESRAQHVAATAKELSSGAALPY